MKIPKELENIEIGDVYYQACINRWEIDTIIFKINKIHITSGELSVESEYGHSFSGDFRKFKPTKKQAILGLKEILLEKIDLALEICQREEK
jgi:hypothetical protein